MEEAEKILTEKESLELISQMINKAKNSYHDSGIGPILWGSVIALCSLVTFLQIRFDFPLPFDIWYLTCLLYTSPSPRDRQKSRMPSSA